MPQHPDLATQFLAALRGGPLPDGLTTHHRDEVQRRFAVYRNNVAAGLAAALAARFPVIQRLLGQPYFAALAGVYADAHRPASPILAEWGAGFARFLDGFAPLSDHPYLGDVARIEYARGRAFHAADARPVDPAALAGLDPDRIRLRLHPSVAVLALAHPAVSIWARHQPGGQSLPLASGPETALILRDAAFQVPVRALGPGDAALLRSLLSHGAMAVAAATAQADEPGHDPQPLLVSLMRAGAIVDATE